MHCHVIFILNSYDKVCFRKIQTKNFYKSFAVFNILDTFEPRGHHFSKMAAQEYRAVIRYCMLRGLSPAEAHNEMLGACGEARSSLSAVRRRHREFSRGKASLARDTGSGRQPEASSNENFNAVHAMIVNDRRVTIKHMAEMIRLALHQSIESYTKSCI